MVCSNKQTLAECASAQSNKSLIKDIAEEHKDMQSLKVMTIICTNARGFTAQMCVEHLMHVAIQFLTSQLKDRQHYFNCKLSCFNIL